MKILYISNYEPWKLVSKGLMPSNHLFGINEILDRLTEDERGQWHGKFEDGIVDFVYVKNFDAKQTLKYYVLACHYDVVYDVLNVISKYVGLIPKCLRPFKLVSILHHPPFDTQLKYASSDAYIFFSQALMNIAKDAFPSMQDKMFVNEWRPDYDYYHRDVKQELKYDFIDCGRTNRDHKTVIQALIATESKGLFFDKKRILEQKQYEIKEGINTFFYKDNFIPDNQYVNLMKSAKVMVLALPKSDKILGPLGATVIMDALGLGMPIICSDNSYCSELVEREGLGLVYKAEDPASLALCMNELKNEQRYNECKQNIVKYNLGGDLLNYSKKLMRIFYKVLNKKENEENEE